LLLPYHEGVVESASVMTDKQYKSVHSILPFISSHLMQNDGGVDGDSASDISWWRTWRSRVQPYVQFAARAAADISRSLFANFL